MSMYKKIFWSEEYKDYSSGAEVASISGEVLIFGQSAFASLDEAVAAAGAENAIVIKVASGKYDSFTVVTNGVRSAASPEVVAVNFGGGTVENVTVDPVDAPADLQAAIIDNLNNIHAAEGKIFVAAENVSESSSTLFIGAADTVSNVTAANGDAALFINEEYVQNIGNTVEIIASGTELYVSNSYNDETEGYGTTKFSNYQAAYNYAVANNKYATIVVEGTNTLSGNCFDNSHMNYSDMAVVVKDGASVGNALSKWDMTYKVTVEAGGKIEMARPKNASVSYTHVKNVFTIGEAGASEKAYVNFLSDTHQDGDLQIRYNGKIIANNAVINVQDFDAQGSATLNDTEMYVDGVFATTTGFFYKTTLNNTDIVVGGTQIAGGLSDISGGGTFNQLGNVTMTDSSIEFKTGDVKVAANVKMSGNSSLTAKNLIINSGKTLTMDSTSTLTLDSLAGDGKINIKLLDGFKLGDKVVDFTGNNATEDMLSKITFSGANGYEAEIVDGDIVIGKASVKVDDGMLDLSQNDAFTKEGATLGTATDDLSITTGAKDSTDVTETAEIKSDVVGKDITLENSKNLAVTGSIEATGTATLTNKGANLTDAEGNLVAEAVLNGGYDAEGNEKAAKIEAEKIVLQNDGHANVELTAKDINIANNSNETLTGTIGDTDTNSVVIAAGTATADGVDIDGTLDGSIKDATITGTNISIAEQSVSDSTFNGRTAIAADSSLDNTKVNGVVSVGYDAENAADTTLTLKGETSIGTLYVGKEGRENEYKAVITGKDTDVSLGQLYNRLGSTLEITDGAHLEVNNYWQSKGDVVIDGASAELTGVNMYVYNNDTTDAATITLRNGASLSTKANYAIYLGNSEGGPAKGNASMTLESGSSLNVKNLTLHADGEVEEVAGAKASTSVSVTDSTLNVSGLLTNNGTVTIGGESELNIAAATGKAVDFADGAVITSESGANFSDATHSIGGVTFGSGKFNFAGSAMAYDKLALNAGADVTAAQSFAVYDDATIADGASVSANSVYVNGGNVTLAGDLTAKGNDGGLLLRNSNKSFNVDGGNVDVAYIEGTRGTVAVNLTNATVKGGHHITDNGGTLNWDIDNSSVSARTWTGAGDIKVNNGEITVTETLTNNGTFTVAGESTLKIAELAGNTITALDGAKLSDTTIASTTSTELVVGEQDVASTVTFAGDNKISKISAGAGDSVIVEAGASLELTGNRSGIGSGATWSINGGIVDAKAVTDEEKADLTVAFNAVNGLSLSDYSGSTTTWNINNAYAKVGAKNGVTSKNDNNAGGKFEINITNSIFESASKWAINTPKNDTITNQPAFELNVKDSVFTVNNYYTNNQTNSVANVDNSKFSATAFGNIGEFNVTNGAEATFGLANAVQDWASKGSLNAGKLYVNDASFTITNTSIEFYNVGDIILEDGATVTFGKLVNAAANDVTLGAISTTFADQVGSITIDADSNFIAQSLTGAGTITIDAAGWTGYNKVIDLSGTESLKGKVSIENLEEGVFAIYGADGDVILTDADMSKILVNEAYASLEVGTKVGDGVYAGVNAFGKLSEAINAQVKGTTESIVLESNISEDYFTSIGGANIITNIEGGVTVNNTYEGWVYVSGNTHIGENVALNSTRYFLYGTGNVIDGKLDASYQNYHRYDDVITINPTGYLGNHGEAFIIRYNTENGSTGGLRVIGDSALNADAADRKLQLEASYFSFYSGTIDASDTLISGGPLYMNNSQDGAGEAVVKLDNTIWNVKDNDVQSLTMDGNASIILDNYSQMTTTKKAIISSATNTIEVKNNSSFKVNGDVSNAGTIKVADSVFTAATITNSGTITLTVTADKLASVTANAYYMVNQTGNGAALDLTVNYNGASYGIGDQIVIGDTVYTVTNGDGNDIAIQAQATTVILDAAAEENLFTVFNKADTFFEMHNSYENRIHNAPEVIKVNGTNALESTASKYYVYADTDLSITGGTLDVSSANRFYFMDTVAPNGTAAKDADLNDIATVTIEEDATLKGYINLGQAIDNSDIDENGITTRDGGAMNMIVKGTLDHKNLYVNTGSTLTVTETGKVTNYASGGDNHIRSGAKVVVNGTGKDGDVQFASNWWSIRGGDMEFNNTNAETGTLRLNADADNALVTGDTAASLTVNNSRLDAYSIEVDNADSSFTAKDSIIETTLLENAGTASVTGDSTLKVNKLVGTLNVADATINDGSYIKGKAGSVDISGEEVNFDGNVTIEAAVNSNKSEDATTININEGAVVTIAGKEFDAYNGGVNLGASDTLNVDGTLNITAGDNVYLKATTNVAEGGALNITDAGFQNTYGKLTVKGDMNITDTYEDGAYQNIKLAGNDNASTTGSLDVDGGTLTIDAPSFAFGGGFKSNGWVDVTSADVTVQNGGKITSNAVVFRNGANSTVTLDNGTFEFTAAPDFGTVHVTLGTQIDNNGTIIAKNGSTLDFGDRTFINAGTINIDGSNFNADGTVTNNGTFIISGESSVKINELLGTKALRTADGATLLDSSYIKGNKETPTLRALGDLEIAGDFTLGSAELGASKYAYFRRDSDDVAADLTIGNTLTVNGQFNWYNGTIAGGQINAQYAQFWNNDIQADVTAYNIYMYDNSVVNGVTVKHSAEGGEPLYLRGNVSVVNGGVLTAGNSIWVGDMYYPTDGSLTVSGTADKASQIIAPNVSITTKESFMELGENTELIADTVSNTGTFTANGSNITVTDAVTNAGTLNVNDSTFAAGTFDHQSTTHAIFNDVDMDVTNFKNGVKDAGAYAIIGGNSKVQIDNLSGDRLHFADGTVLKDGTSIKGTTSTRSLGDITFGETENDLIHVDSFANNGTSAYDGTITVNGTLSISDNGDDKLSPTYWLGIHGSESGTLLTSETGKGVINSSGLWNIFQYGKITVDEGVTINIADAYARDLRFTLTDITIKGEINSIGNNNKLNAIQTSTVTITGENAALNVDGYLLVGYSTYKYPNDTTDMYKSTVTVEGGAALNVGGNLYINKDSSIMVDLNSEFSVEGSIMNYGGMINSANAGEIVVNQDMVIAGNITTDILTITQGAALSAGSLTVTNLLNLEIGSDLSVAGASSIGTITVLGELVPENAEFVLVSTGWANLGETTVMYKGTEYTVTDSIDGLTGLNFVTVGGNLYVKDFGAAISGIYIGELPANAQTDDKITTADGATYTVGVDAFAKAADAADKVDVDAVESITLGDGDHVNEVAANFSHISEITIHEGITIVDDKAAAFSNDLVINNNGHLDSQITVGGELIFTNTAKDTLVGSYTAENITGTNTGAMAGSYTATTDIIIDNNAGSIGGDKGEAIFEASYVAITGGDASNVTVNADILDLTDNNTFGLNATSGILAGSMWGAAGTINLNGSANMSIDGDMVDDTDAVILGYTDEHTGTLTLNGKQTYSGDISANKIVVADGKVVTFNKNTVDFNELNVAGTLNTDFTVMDSFNDAGEVTGTGTLNSTHTGPWIVNDSVTRDVTGFAGTVTMENADAEIVLKNDKSYFGDDAKMVIKTGQTVTLAKDAAATGIDFSSYSSGAGTINVGAYDTAFADVSTGFTQTLSGSNDNFTGTVNVSEEAKLILQSGIGGSINLDAKADTGKATTLELGEDGLEVAATITGDANDIINVAENAALTSDAALNNFAGTVAVNAKELTLGGENETAAKFTSTEAGVLNVNDNNTLTAAEALNGFDGTINLTESILNLNNANTTNAVVKGDTASQLNISDVLTLNTTDAISGFNGTVKLYNADDMLTLKGTNSTAATVNGAGVIDADADQTFSGDVSGFSGTYDIATQVTLSGTIADTINAKGDTLTLSNATGKNITVNAGTGSKLENLAFGANNVVLGTGDFDNVSGTGDITAFGFDKEFITVEADEINVKDSDDLRISETLQATINLTIDAAVANTTTDIDYNGAAQWDDKLNVSITNEADFAGTYKLVDSASGFAAAFAGITLTVAGDTAALNINQSVKLGGYSWSLRENGGVLELTKRSAYSNFVVVNTAWTEDPYAAVMDGNTDRAIGYDAAGSLDDAVSYIKGAPKGEGWVGTNAAGEAKIELTSGKFTQDAGSYLMTADNEVLNLTIASRNGESAILNSEIHGSDGTKATTMILENVQIRGDVYGGGNLVINNGAATRASGNVIAAGIGNVTAGDAAMANDSALTINGGYYNQRMLVGGSVNTVENTTVTVDGNTKLVIDNQNTEKLVITSNLYGGSWAAKGNVVQNGDAEILIKVNDETQIRGSIFVNGGASNYGNLTMNGNSVITFTGDGSKLTFTSTVSAINGTNTTETIVFDNYTGAFNGTISGFDVISIKGDTSLSLGRRQTKTGDTAFSFTVNGDTTDAAMYTVRDNDSWEFAKNISVTVDGTTNAGTYVLVDNYIGGFEGFTFTFNGVDYTLGNAVDGKVITVSDDQLVLTVAGNNTNLVGNTTEQIVIDSSAAGKETQIVGDVVDNATTNSSAAVKITTDEAVISNTGTITGAETQKSVAIEIQSGTSDAVVNNSGTITAADVAKYNRAIYSEGKDLAVSNSGTINGEIYQNTYGAQSLDVNNSGTITAMTSDMGSNSVISSSNGIINLTGDGGTYELAANTETGKFNGEIVEGQHGIAISASNTTFKAGTDVTVGNGTVKGLFNDSGKNIVISGDNNTIAIVGRRGAIGIEEFSYEGQSDVVISGDNNTISVTSASGATGIVGRNGAVVITGSGTEINVTSTGSYAYGIETQDVKDYSGDVIIGEFNTDGSVAQASDIQITVDGQVSTNSNPVMSPIGVYAKKGTAQIALAEDGKIECESFTAVKAEKVQITNAGTIIGDVVATGSATDDTVSMDIDAILNGSMSGVDKLAVTGVSALATDVAGAKTIIGGVDDVLASASIDGVAADLNGTKVQIAGAATAETTDDVWASLTKNTDDSLTVAWGRSEAEVGAALDAFKADSTLTLGDSMVASAATLDDADAANDFSKKSRGTLA